jgi:hypothetical protein
MTAWLEAQGAFAEALATFQAKRPTAASGSMEAILEAIAPAHDLGFAYSVLQLADEAHVRLMHRSGWDLSSTAGPDGEWWMELADLLGVAVGLAAPAAAAQPEPAPAKAKPRPVAVVPDPASAAEPDEFADADLMGEGVPETPVLPEDREPLSQADRETCLAMIRAVTPEQRKKFTVAFRSHFNIDKDQKAIAPHIVQVQHQKFIQAFVDELELVGEAA